MSVWTPPVAGAKTVPAEIGRTGLGWNCFLIWATRVGAKKITPNPRKVLKRLPLAPLIPIKGGDQETDPAACVDERKTANKIIIAVAGKTTRLAIIFKIHSENAFLPGMASISRKMGPKIKLINSWIYEFKSKSASLIKVNSKPSKIMTIITIGNAAAAPAI